MSRPARPNDEVAFARLLIATSAGVAGVLLAASMAWLDGAQTHLMGLVILICRGGQHMIAGTAAVILFGAVFLFAIVFAVTTIAALICTRLVTRRFLSKPAVVRQDIFNAAIAAGLGGRIDICQDSRAVVFTYGLFRPRVLITTGSLELLSPVQLKAVLAHEASHVHKRDPLRTLISTVVGRALFMFPLVAELGRHFRTESELVADDAAIRATDRGVTAAALMKFLEAPRFHLLPGIAPTTNNDIRIMQLIASDSFCHRFTPSRLSIALTIAVVLVACLLVGVATQIPPMPMG